jgi:hypothetical protein
MDRIALFRAFWLAALAAVLVAASAVRAATVALVTDVVGDATLVNGASEPLKLLGELPANAEVAVGGASHAVVFYLADGGEYTLRGPGRYTLAAKAPMAQKGAPAPEKKLAAAAYRDLKLRRDRVQRGGILMRGDPRPSLLQPVNEVVLDGSVTFAWEPVGDGASYQFELVDQAGQKLLIAETRDAELRLPDAVQLKPGRVYYWSLRGRDAQSPQPFYRAAEFHVADLTTKRRLDAARPKPDASFSERVLYAALLEEAGAASAALAWRHTLAAERPVAWAPGR